MRMDDCLLVKSITLLAAPEDYLLSNGFIEYKIEQKRRRK